ncbi:zygote arrest protein 1 [Patagioenas fasciata monilis]|uniref:Zygote arrest protein 1 n=1 Tax=Patagioenas fasciata monilis TaxID=372326 RepID=A0A1V4JH57_PATFA|nr:zygote arrest protein 1 [Patagioenas fasciata monilis]
MAEEAMESYLYAAYHPYSYRYPPPKGKGAATGGWRPRGSGYFSGYGEAAAAAEYFDNYQRAQLKAILSQVNPNLTPRLRKANTKEVGVQKREPAVGKTRLRFQFLEQKYGYYHCKDCNIRWESAYVWCVQGTNKVYFRQFCRTCQKSYNPYRVEDITCQSCKQTRCTCPVKMRHVDPKRPHRQDLCGRCKGKRLSCDSTFSFKYII